MLRLQMELGPLHPVTGPRVWETGAPLSGDRGGWAPAANSLRSCSAAGSGGPPPASTTFGGVIVSARSVAAGALPPISPAGGQGIPLQRQPASQESPASAAAVCRLCWEGYRSLLNRPAPPGEERRVPSGFPVLIRSAWASISLPEMLLPGGDLSSIRPGPSAPKGPVRRVSPERPSSPPMRSF